jgi:hypothetical protein
LADVLSLQWWKYFEGEQGTGCVFNVVGDFHSCGDLWMLIDIVLRMMALVFD